MNIEVIDKETLPRYRDLILPYIYEELENCREDLADENYICLSGTAENDDGILIPIAAEHRRQGIASELLEKAIFVSRQLFVFEDGEDEEFINLKAVYRLSEKFKNPFEEFLKKNNFTDFYLLDEHDNPQVWAAVEEIRFYKKT